MSFQNRSYSQPGEKQGFNLLVVLGPTASGKTQLAITLAKTVQGEILSADSRQVFRGMDIGTGKDLAEYGEIPYHLIDVCNPGEEFNLFLFQGLFYRLFAEIQQRGRLPILAGGTGLYLEAVIRNYALIPALTDPLWRNETMDWSMAQLGAYYLTLRPNPHTLPKDREHLLRAIEIAKAESLAKPMPPAPGIQPLILGLRWERSRLRQRITDRLQARLATGLIDEVRTLLAQGIRHEILHGYGLEYRYVSLYVRGELNEAQLFQQLNTAIHQFAKRQETWFRRMERQGITIHWLDASQDPCAQALALIQSQPARVHAPRPWP